MTHAPPASASLVVDASVVVKWFLNEENSDAARRLLAGPEVLLAPDLVYAEVGNVLWKRSARGELSREEVDRIAAVLLDAPLTFRASTSLLPASVAIACETRQTVYDCLYLALARAEDCMLVTADIRLCNALAGSAYASGVLWLGAMRTSS